MENIETKTIETDQSRLDKISSWYLELCDLMNSLWIDIVEYLQIYDESPFDPVLFENLISAKNKIKFLDQRFTELHNGASPISQSQFSLNDLNDYIVHLSNFEANNIVFLYPFQKLYSNENMGFMLTDEFRTMASVFCSDKVNTQEPNK